jgi:hypothetical protein
MGRSKEWQPGTKGEEVPGYSDLTALSGRRKAVKPKGEQTAA